MIFIYIYIYIYTSLYKHTLLNNDVIALVHHMGVQEIAQIGALKQLLYNETYDISSLFYVDKLLPEFLEISSSSYCSLALNNNHSLHDLFTKPYFLWFLNIFMMFTYLKLGMFVSSTGQNDQVKYYHLVSVVCYP